MATTSDPAYGLTRPTLADAQRAVSNLHPDDAAQVWTTLLSRAGCRSDATEPGALDDVIAAMRATSPLLALSAQALHIRAVAYDHLAAAHTVLRSTL